MKFFPIDIKTVESGVEFDMSGSPSEGTLLNSLSSDVELFISDLRKITCDIKEYIGAGYCQDKPIKPVRPGPGGPYKYLIKKDNANFMALTSLLVSSYTAGSEIIVTYEIDQSGDPGMAVVKQIAIK